MLADERRAWEWARANALVWTPTMEREAQRGVKHYEAAFAGEEAAYYYDQVLAFTSDLLLGNSDGEQVCDALVRNASEIAELYNGLDARRVLLELIDKYLVVARLTVCDDRP
jgi:hypothetical protein